MYTLKAAEFFDKVLNYLYPVRLGVDSCGNEAKDNFCHDLTLLLESSSILQTVNSKKVVENFKSSMGDLRVSLDMDIDALADGDPAVENRTEIILCYPGFYAIAAYRIAHFLCQQGVDILPRVITEHAHSRTGIDIHPKAKIGSHFFIDHGTGVVIGETTTVGNNVKVYQGVTLGALSVHPSLKSKKRHPTIEDDVVIYAQATILGGETVIGKGSIIGGNVWLTKSVPAESKVYYKPTIEPLQDSGKGKTFNQL